MATADEVVVQFEARIGRYEADLKRAQKTFEQTTKRQRNEIRALERQFMSSTSSIGSSIRGLAGTLAGAFTVRELVRLTDTFTRFQNNLRVAGLEGAALADVQARLLATANQYGVEVETLSSVFLKASLAQKELGASTDDILRLNQITAAALKITGTSAEQAQGALLQLGQALSAGTVRAEEFNSILEGALPIAQAAARGIEGFDGSVAKLRAAVLDGTITSKQFFDGVLAGGVQTLEDAERATLTLSGGITALTNALAVYFGEANKANGVTAALGEALGLLADNLDIIIPALAVIAVAIGGRLAAAALVGGGALRAVSAYASIATTSLAGTALAARGLGAALLGAFGGPVGLAITAITLGIGYFASEAIAASIEADNLRAVADQNAAEFGNLADQASKAGKELAQLNIEQTAAAASAAGLTIDIDRLADAHYRAAVAARAQRIEEQKLALAASGKEFARVYREELGRARNGAFGTADQNNAAFGGRGNSFQAIENARAPSLAEREEAAYKRIVNSPEYKTYKRDQATLNAMREEPITVPEAGGGGAAGGGGGGGGRRGGASAAAAQRRAERDAERAARDRVEALRARNDLLEQLTDAELRGEAEILDAQARAATSADERVDLLRELLNTERELRFRALDDEFNQAERRIDDLEGLSDQEKAQLRDELAARKKAAADQLQRLYGQRAGTGKASEDGITVSGDRGGLLGEALLRDYNIELEQQLNDELAARASALRDLADLELNNERRFDLQQQALDLEQQIARSLLEQAIANGKIADADKARALLATSQAAQRESLNRDQLSPVRQFQFDLQSQASNLNTELENIGVEALKTFNAELTDAIVNFKSFGDVGRAVVRSLTASLVQLALQQLTLKLINATLGTSAVAATSAQAATTAAAWAPAAALASLATLGGNAAPAAAALAGTTALSQALAATGGAFQDGGPITGPGGPRQDKVLIAASPEEYMINAAAARRLGRSTLDYMNATGRLPSLADGGPVMPLLPTGAMPARAPAAQGLDASFQRDLRAAIAEATRTMPPIQLFPTIRPEDVLSEALKTPAGRRAMFEFTNANSGKINSQLR